MLSLIKTVVKKCFELIIQHQDRDKQFDHFLDLLGTYLQCIDTLNSFSKVLTQIACKAIQIILEPFKKFDKGIMHFPSSVSLFSLIFTIFNLVY